jgi:3-methyladenine DNA glycosylase AlkD
VSRALIAELRRELARRADPVAARAMQAYMKSAMPYYGVPTPARREIQRRVFDAHPLPDFAAWRDTSLALWRGAKRREERYAAIGLAGHPPYAAHRTLRAMPLYEEMIVTGAWWDYVDGIAGERLGELLRRYPAALKPRMRRWSRSPDLWKRRSAILCQLGFKADTDLRLLYDCIAPNLADREFFIRKAIGWALRQYAWTDPREVERFVREHRDSLSPLSRREALKNIRR